MTRRPRILIASRNPGKVREVRAVLRGSGAVFADLCGRPDIPPLPETGKTFQANAEDKALAVARATGCIAIADDSGLEVDALGGAPGVRSARFAPTDEKRIARLLRLLRDVPAGKRAARFTCAVSVATPDAVVGTVLGVCRGRIAGNPEGKRGFGYDPVFTIPALNKTFAQMTAAEKNRISHRGRALRKARPLIKRAIASSEKQPETGLNR